MDESTEERRQATVVEWFAEKLEEFNGRDNPWFDIPLELLEKAKQMEKDEIETIHQYYRRRR